MTTASAVAFSNIALIKYWGDRDNSLHLPANGSISMNLDELYTRTQVTFDVSLSNDKLTLNGQITTGEPWQRVTAFLDHIREMSGIQAYAQVISDNNFPMGAGIASSASAFAALSLAASCAAGLKLDPKELSRLARRGSGSACRSIPAGFVEWQAGDNDETSFATSIASPEYWDLTDCIAIVDQSHKTTVSVVGHSLASSSPLQAARIADTPRRLSLCRQALLERDFSALAAIVELDANMMHAVMLTSTPALIYWQPGTLEILQAVSRWQASGLPVCYTIDAGPNVHVLCPSRYAAQVAKQLSQVTGVIQVLTARAGGAAYLVPAPKPTRNRL